MLQAGACAASDLGLSCDDLAEGCLPVCKSPASLGLFPSSYRGMGSLWRNENSIGISGCSARERDLPQNFQDAPHRRDIFFQIFRMLHAGARFSSKFSRCSTRERNFQFLGCSARERNFLPNFQGAPHGSAILNQKKMKFRGCSARERDFFLNIRMLRAAARFGSKFSGCSARERDFFPTFQNAPHVSAILIKKSIGMLLMGA